MMAAWARINKRAPPMSRIRRHHRLLSADALRYRIRAHTFRQILDAGHPFITALRHDIRSTRLQSELLSVFVPAHGVICPAHICLASMIQLPLCGPSR